MTIASTDGLAVVAKLTLCRDGAPTSQQHLADGATLMVGSGANCGVMLDDPAVSSIHCVLRVTHGELIVQDWCSNLGTLVNGVPIEEETTVGHGGRIDVGRFQIRIELNHDVAESADASDCDAPSLAVADSHEPSAAATVGERQPEIQQSDEEPSPELSPLDSDRGEEYAAQNESMTDPETLEDSHVAEAANDSPDDRLRTKSISLDGIDPEVVDLLQAEIECLQSDLTDRDRQLSELQELASGATSDEPSSETTDNDALVGRLEQLLDELEGSDQRVSVLEELLHAEQEVTRAQRDEVGQVEAWLINIEQRVSNREGEWEAERRALLNRIETLKNERDEADRRLAVGGANPDESAMQENAIKDLRASLDRLQDERDVAETQRAALEREINELKSKGPEQVAKEILEDALREDRLKMAQERADLSRERAQLGRRRVEVDGTAQQNRRSEADERFRAFRQTLKELHQEDMTRTPGVRKSSLGARISDLWRRLDGPTDTD